MRQEKMKEKGKMAIVEKSELAALLPHANGMVLLDTVRAWDGESIECLALSHVSADNPLAIDGRVSVYAGVEYAAQAMALHNALLASQRASSEKAEHPRQGVVAVVSKLKSSIGFLSDCADQLQIKVALVESAGDSSMYDFELLQNETLCLSGRLLVLLV